MLSNVKERCITDIWPGSLHMDVGDRLLDPTAPRGCEEFCAIGFIRLFFEVGVLYPRN